MENRRLVSGLQWIPLLLPLGLAIWACAGLVRLWGKRLDHPYDLEWMEGGMLTHAWRIVEGQPLYGPPSETFIPFIYPPGYAWLLATLSQWMPLEHGLGRSVSLVGIMLAATAIVAFVVRHRASWMGGWVSGLLCAAAFLLVYPASGAFYDLVRPDALGLGLMAWAMVFGLDKKARWVALGGVLLCLSFLMKHHAAAFGLPVFLALWSRDGLRRAVWFAIWSAGPALTAIGVLQWTTDGHFLTYILSVPATHGLKATRIFPGLAMELGYALPLVGLLTSLGSALLLSMRWKSKGGLAFLLLVGVGIACGVWGAFTPVPDGLRVGARWESALGFAAMGMMFGVILLWLVQIPKAKRLAWEWVFGVSLAVVTFVIVLLMRGHHGGYLNVYMPAHWGMALGLGIVSCQLLDWVKSGEGKDYRWVGVALYAIALCGVLTHAVMQIDEERLSPTDEDVAAGDEWVAYLAEQEGPVLSPFAPWLAVQAGHEPAFHLIALWDVHDEWHKNSPYPGTYQRIVERVEQGYWKTIVDTRKSMGFEVKKRYEVGRSFPSDGRVMRPKTGWPARPEVVRVPPAKLTPGLVRLPQWTGATVPAAAQSIRLTFDEKYVWLQGRDTPVEDLGELLDQMKPEAIRVQADAQTDLNRLQSLFVHAARRGISAIQLEVLTTTGRGRIELLTRPQETEMPAVRVLIGDSRMMVTTMNNQRIVLGVTDPGVVPEGLSLRPVISVAGTLQDALVSLSNVQGLGWRDVYLGIQWPNQVPEERASNDEIKAFWQTLAAPQTP